MQPDKKMQICRNSFFVTVAALLCCALWGSATPFIKIGYGLLLPQKNVPSIILFAGIRFAIAGILAIALYSISRRKFLYPQKENWGRIVKIAAVQTVIQYLFFYIGLANTSGVKGTIISGSNVFFAIIIAALLYRQERLTWRKIVGCLLGFAGIIAVNLNGLDLNMNFTGDAFVLFSTISYAFSSVLIKRYSQYEDPVIISGYQFLTGGIIMIAIGFSFGGSVEIATGAGMGVLIYLAFLSAVAYSLWGVLLQYNPVSRITVFSFMIPVFGVLLSSLMLDEASSVTPVQLIVTLVLICAGILVLNFGTGKEKT